jgi:PAS domain S-box-containing protein
MLSYQTQQSESDLVFRKLFRISNDSILIFGNRGRKLLDANPQALKALGYSRRELRSLSPERLFVDQKSVEQFFESLWKQPVRSDKSPSLVRIAYRHKSGRIMGANLSASMILHSGEPAALAVVGETYRRRRISDLVKNQARLSSLLHAVTDVHTARNCIKLWLRRVCKYAQLPIGHVHVLVPGLVGPRGKIDIWHVKRARAFDSVRRNPAWMTFPEPSRSRVATTRMPEVVADLEQYPNFGRPELRGLNLRSAVAIPVGIDDTVEAVSEFFSPSRLEEDPLLVDVLETLGRELGCMLRQHTMSLKLMKAQDDERRRLASELHDTTAQGLAMILLDLGLVEKESQALSLDARAALSQIMGLARRSLEEVRTFSYLLHPPMLEELGLLATLRIFLEGFSRRSAIQLDVDLPGSLPRTSPDWEMAVFRVVQEGLTNVRRHSRSRTATVRFRVIGDMALVIIENEGASVPPLEEGGLPPERVGVGIGGMRERLRAFGGDVMLYSRDDMTVLEAKVRIAKAPRSPAHIPRSPAHTDSIARIY